VWFCLALLYAVGKERPYIMWEALHTIQKHKLLPPQYRVLRQADVLADE
jgi:hypothetical protein